MLSKLTILISIWATICFCAVAGDEANGSPVFQTHFAVTGRMTDSLVISNQYTNFSHSFPFSLQRQGDRWRMQVAMRTNEIVRDNQMWLYYDIGCDGTNVYSVFHDYLSGAPTNRHAAQVFPGVVCTVPNGEKIWLAFLRDVLPANQRSFIPRPIGNAHINHWAHISLHGSAINYSGDEARETGWFVVDKERLEKAHLSPYLFTNDKSVGVPYAPGQTDAVYHAVFRKDESGKYWQKEFMLLSYWPKPRIPDDAEFLMPDPNRVLITHFEYKMTSLNEAEFNCYPVTGTLLDIYDGRLWDKQKRIFTHYYKSTNFLAPNELHKAAYVLDIAKVMEERKRGEKTFGTSTPVAIMFAVLLLGPLGYWWTVVRNKNKRTERKDAI